MSEPVCQDDWEAYRLFGTPDDFTLDAFAEDVNYGMSPGLIAWRAIAFALERRVDLPLWVRQYLAQTAAGIENWAMLNGHPAELKDVLALNGQRKPKDDRNDPRWIYDAICQLREHDPKASVASLVRECMKQFPQVGAEEEYVRQKYYQGKRLAETGEDYKGRGRKGEVVSVPVVSGSDDGDLAF